MTLSPEYVAGFFDGEGCINITIRGKYKQVVLRVMIVNTDSTILACLYAKFGGALMTPRNLGKGKPWKSFRSLVMTGRVAENFLTFIEPHIILKRPQLELALEFSRLKHLPRGERCYIAKCSYPVVIKRKPEVIAKELEFKARLHLLNKKGAA